MVKQILTRIKDELKAKRRVALNVLWKGMSTK